MTILYQSGCQLESMQKSDLIEWLVADAVWTIPHLAVKGRQVEEPSRWGRCRRLRANMLGKSPPPRLPSLFQFILEGTNHQEEVEPKRPTDYADGDVRRVWVAGDAEQDAEDVEEKWDSHNDDPGHHEEDVPLKYRYSWVGNIDARYLTNLIETHHSGAVDKAGRGSHGHDWGSEDDRFIGRNFW